MNLVSWRSQPHGGLNLNSFLTFINSSIAYWETVFVIRELWLNEKNGVNPPPSPLSLRLAGMGREEDRRSGPGKLTPLSRVEWFFKNKIGTRQSSFCAKLWTPIQKSHFLKSHFRFLFWKSFSLHSARPGGSRFEG